MTRSRVCCPQAYQSLPASGAQHGRSSVSLALKGLAFVLSVMCSVLAVALVVSRRDVPPASVDTIAASAAPPTVLTARRQFLGNSSLTVAQMRRARTCSGNTHRLREVARKLLTGESVRVLVMGGSISAGHGALNGLPSCHGKTHKHCSYGGQLLRWLQSAFPREANSEHVVHVKAKPSTNHEYADAMILDFLDEDAEKGEGGYDLVLVEFAVNDNGVAERLPSMERVIRKLLQWEPLVACDNCHSPAFAYLCFPSPKEHKRSELIELHHDVIHYYQVPQLSLWDAVYQEWSWLNTSVMPMPSGEEHRPKLARAFVQPRTPYSVWASGVHFGQQGHRMVSDMVAFMLLEAVADLMELADMFPSVSLASPLRYGVHPFYEQPPPVPSSWFFNDDRVSDEQLMVRNFFYTWNYKTLLPSFKPAPCSGKEEPSGWSYYDDGHGFGWMAVDSDEGHTSDTPICFSVYCPSVRCTVAVGYLASYASVGKFEVTVFDPFAHRVSATKEVDPLWDEHTSELKLVSFDSVFKGETGKEENIAVSVMIQRKPLPSRSINKVKIMSLTTYEYRDTS